MDSLGGTFAIGFTADGQIAVAAARTKRVEFFSPDESLAGPPRQFTCSDGLMNGVLRPSDCRVEGVAFADPIQVRNPRAHWTTLMLFPLWDPFVAWLLVVSGMVGIGVKRHQNKHGASPELERAGGLGNSR